MSNRPAHIDTAIKDMSESLNTIFNTPGATPSCDALDAVASLTKLEHRDLDDHTQTTIAMGAYRLFRDMS